MVVAAADFSDPLAVAMAGAARREINGLAFTLVTTPQRKCLEEQALIAVWRDGNQLGKSYWLAMEAIHTARGTHPHWDGHPPPCKIVVMGVSVEQMEPLMEKIWELVPKNEIDERNGFDPGRGITGKPPRIVFTSGPGKGSVISFATYRQGAKNLAGKTVALVIMDEPPDKRVYGEVVPRVFREGGRIRIGMTPAPDMPDCSWLQEMIEAGDVVEHNYGLCEANLWLEGAPGPFLTQAEVDAFEASLLPVEREMRMGRSWDPVPTERWLSNFDPSANVVRMAPPMGARIVIGVDHGLKAGKQTAILMAHWSIGSTERRVLYWDEEAGDGRTTALEDANAILKMLERRGLSYDDVDEWVGDRPLSQSREVRKSNQILRKKFAELLKRPLSTIAPMPTPRKNNSGSYELNGLGAINSRLRAKGGDGTPMLMLHKRCVNLSKSFLVYQGSKTDPVKDHLDAARYAFERMQRDHGTGKRMVY